jgi:proline iminopeptidase
MYPDVEPYDRGLLTVDGGHAIYWECSGNPNGKPAVYIHGGPGSGSTASARRYFDPKAYKIVLFDQRGCGRSRPLVTRKFDLEINTTQHLVRDIESLRRHLSIDRWVALGSSWGTTLALAYAQMHPDRLDALVLACVTMTSRREVDWITRGVGRIFPQQWERFSAFIPDGRKDLPIVDAYASLLFDDDASICAKAAEEWCAWEDSHVSLAPGYVPNRRFLDCEYRLRFSRIVTHYWRHAAFLEEDQLLGNAHSLKMTPVVLIQGAHDVSSPVETAWRLHKHLPSSRLDIISDAGHGGASMTERVSMALDEFRS